MILKAKNLQQAVKTEATVINGVTGGYNLLTPVRVSSTME
jgi:hypothetical protein